MVGDTIADFLTQVRNAVQREKESISLKSSKMLLAISKILKEEGYISEFTTEKNEVQDVLTINLKYVGGVSAITELKRVSKPGVRKYRGYKEIKSVKNGMGIAIFSTPLGVITGEEAVKNKVGGEFICEIF